MSVIEYHNLKYNVSEGIDWTTKGKRLLYICKTFLPDESNIQDVLSLLDKLEKEKRLAIDSLAVLKELLKQLDEWNLFEMVEKFENKRKEYKSFLEQCGGVLDECSQLERLISLCEGKISHDSQVQIKDVFMLFRELEKQNNLEIELLEILKTMATEMDKPDLLRQVEEFDTKRKQEEDADRNRRKRQVQSAAVLASARYAGARLMGIVTPQCTFRNVAGGIVVVTTWMILRRSSSLQEFVHTFTEAVLPLGNSLRAISEGSLCFAVQAQTSSALEALWKTYQDGTLQKNLQEFLVTEEIKQLVGFEVTLTVEIDEQEYNDVLWDLVENEAQGDIQEILERIDEWMKEISKKLEILTEPGGVATRDEDILGNIQQVRKEMENIRKTLETLAKTEEKKMHGEPTTSLPSREPIDDDEVTEKEKERLERLERREKERRGLHSEWLEKEMLEMLERSEKERRERFEKEMLEWLEKEWLELREKEMLERSEKERRERFAKERARRAKDSSPSDSSTSSVGGGLGVGKAEVEPEQQKQKEGSRVEFK